MIIVDSPTPRDSPAEADVSPRIGRTHVQILLVDDDPRNLDVLESVLESEDYTLVRAGSADSALLALIDGEFAAIVLDVQLPGMNGLELAQLIKQRKRTRDIPIIFLTGFFPEEKFALEGYYAGAVDYLSKPVNPDILRSKVAVFVDLYCKTRALAWANKALALEVQQRSAAEEALREVNTELERRVEARTRDLVRANDELRESEGRFRLLADTSPVLIWMEGPGGFEFVNRAYADFFGQAADDLLGWAWSKHLHPDDRERFLEDCRSTAEARQQLMQEVRVCRGDGETRWLLVHMVPRFTAQGHYLGRVGSSIDITAIKDAGEALQQARDEALAASHAKDDFLATLSHELRTPLNPVLLIASEGADSTDLPETVRADFASIRKSIEVEAGLIDDLLDLTRISRGKLAFERRALDVHDVLREAIAAVQADVDGKDLRLLIDFEAPQTTVAGDPVRLQQVFWNVLRNAAKFTPENGEIRVSTSQAGSRIVITVTDSGIGMLPGELERIFDPFSQGEHTRETNSARFDGLGLGLTIAKRMVEHHDGCISATSPGRDQGSTILVELPLAADRAPVVHAEAGGKSADKKKPGASQNSRSVRSLRILLVEDHTATRQALSRLLLRRKHEVSAVASVAEALELARTTEFDVVFSDIGLPDGDGCALMAQLHAMQPELCGIALSGYGMDNDVVRSLTAGFVEHITKPVDVQSLDGVIARLAQAVPLPQPPRQEGSNHR